MSTELNVQKGSKIPTVIGTLTIIFCSFGLLGSLTSLISYSFLGATSGFLTWIAEEVDKSLTDMFQQLFRVEFGIVIARFTAQAVGLAAGICLVTKRRVGILLANVYAGLAIAVIAANIAAAQVFISQIGDQVVNLMALAPTAGSVEFADAEPFIRTFVSLILMGMRTATLFGVFGAAYPVVVLSLINLKKAREGLQA